MVTDIYIKTMVCVRCKMAVETVLNEAGIEFLAIDLGRVSLPEKLSAINKDLLKKGLARYELELIEDRTEILIDAVKNEITEVLERKEPMQHKLSVHLSEVLNYNYTYIANIFSEREGITLERYFISRRINKARRMMIYEGMSLKDISEELNYSSVAHFCLQFKKVTGYTPSEYRRQGTSEISAAEIDT